MEIFFSIYFLFNVDIDNFFRLFYNYFMDSKEKNINDLTFEEALKKLEENVLNLEKGDLGLDESIIIYEEGIKYSDYLLKKLDSAEKRVEELSAKDEGSARPSLNTEPLNI